MGRALGRVRDADVRIDLLRYCESRIPLAAPALVAARQAHERRRLQRSRRLIKRFERLSVDDELSRVQAASPWRRSHVWTTYIGSWRDELRRLLAERVTATRDAVIHASGVYFPNRSHEARIAIKRFRYAAELASQTGFAVDARVVRDLKKASDVLGDLHDRQTLVDHFSRPEPRDGSQAEPDTVRIIREVLDAEIADLHHRYLDRRDAVLGAAAAVEHGLTRRFAGPATLTIAGLVAIAGAEMVRRRRRVEPADAIARTSNDAVAVRVLVPFNGRP
jgi:CHAD domain-containing protein